MTAIRLFEGWQLKRRDPNRDLREQFSDPADWLSALVPGGVFQTLLQHGLIPDPFYGVNELELQWVGESDWLYCLEFDAPVEAGRRHLCFDGLDTFATVWLNGTQILTSDNMFLRHRVDVTDALQPGRNEVRILFESAWWRGKALEAANGGPRALWNGDSSRLMVRKAQYQYGWDWGPKLLDTGLWREVRLETRTARIADWHLPYRLDSGLQWAEIQLTAQLEGELGDAQLRVRLLDPEGAVLETRTLKASASVKLRLELHAPRLWFPHRYGAQPLYTVELSLERRDGTVLDSRRQRLGLRRVWVVQEPMQGESGSSFYFKVNGVEMFIGGANWIPDDSFLPRVSRERYRERIGQAKTANLQMLRVWGGGIYEDDAFYDFCDEAGILVWQDFMFACGLYPASPEFLESLRLEATDNLKRLRHHPSLVIWTGNNEDYQLGHGTGAYKPGLSPEANPEMPARVIYERLLPELCQQLTPDTYYQPGSPYLGANPDDPTQGDRHTWEVWGRDARPYRDYRRLEGRFVSEFGLASAPHIDTLNAVLPPEERYPNSPGFTQHFKSDGGAWRLERYLSAIYQQIPTDLETYVYGTQLVQSEAMSAAYRIWRRRWDTPGARAVGGALVWQLNDCWPVTSWALVDSHARAKPAYYSVKRALEPVTINLWPDGALWASNLSLTAHNLSLELRVISLDGTELARAVRDLHLPPNATLELESWRAVLDNSSIVVAARLLDGARVVARETLFPEPFKEYPPADPQLEVSWRDGTLHLSAKRPAKGVFVDLDGLPDNMFDLVPGDPQGIPCPKPGSSVKLSWLGGVQNFDLHRDDLQLELMSND